MLVLISCSLYTNTGDAVVSISTMVSERWTEDCLDHVFVFMYFDDMK